MIHIGNCLEVMPTLPADHFDSIVTDPPYGLSQQRPGGRSNATKGAVMGGFMGMAWDSAVPGPEYWAQALRVAKPGAFLAAFGGTRTFHRLACAIEDAGWELRDTLMWVYGSGFPKSHNGEWGGTALKPAWEPIILARKPLFRTVAATFEAHGTGGLNIDGCRVLGETMPPNTGAGGLPRRTSDEQRGGGTVSQPHDLGRWPANLIHDGSDEVLSGFPEVAARDGANKGKKLESTCYGNFNPERVGPSQHRRDSGSAARFFYCAKAHRADRDDGCDRLPRVQGGQVSNTSGQHITRRDGGAPGLVGNNHPTVKPTDLMRWLCRLVTPAGGHVLDPFAGSGSTGRGALAEGLQFTGIEMDAGYAAIAEARIRAMQPGLALGDAA